jgi:hypothetical protein
MADLVLLPGLIGYILTSLSIIHALMDAKKNRIQRLLMLATLFILATLVELIGVFTGIFSYSSELLMIIDRVPVSIILSWVGIIYSSTIITERLKLSLWQRILTTALISLSLDWGIDPIAVESGAWTFGGGEYFNIPAYNFFGWFFIPLAFLIPYGLSWNKNNKKLKLLGITEVDLKNSLIRKIYTILFVIPLGLGILMLVGLFTRIPFLSNLNSVSLVIWAIFTVVWASGMIIWKKENLQYSHWIDLLPPCILLIIACYYLITGFIYTNFTLGIVMLLTMIPHILALIFTLRKKRD